MGSNMIVIATLIFLLFSAVLLALMVHTMRKTVRAQMEQARLAEQTRLAEDKANIEAVLKLAQTLEGVTSIPPSTLERVIDEILKKQLGEETLNSDSILKQYDNPNAKERKTNDGGGETPSQTTK